MRRELRGERMNYLCIDIEWNTPDNPAEQAELLSIGAACWDSVSKMTRTYFKLIKPQRMDLITSDTYRRLNLGPVVLEQAKPCDEILANFVYTFSNRKYMKRRDVIVLWSQQQWQMLKEQLDKRDLALPCNRIVILRDILSYASRSDFGRRIDFASALQKYGVKHRKELLHNAKYDAQYLIDLYDRVYERMADQPERVSLVHTEASRVLHRPNCRYMKKRAHHVGSWTDALEGWPLCRCCWRKKPPAGSWRMVKREHIKREKREETKPQEVAAKPKKPKAPSLPFDEETFTAYCADRGMTCQYSIGWVYLQTPVSFWKIKHEGSKVQKVLHQSWRLDESAFKRKQQPDEGYHQQVVYNKDIYETADYIYEHDRHYLDSDYIPSYYGGSGEND